jgi:hypothetical protein
MNQLSAHRHVSQKPPQPISRRTQPALSTSRPESNAASTQPFVEDFNMEHCGSAVSVGLLAFSADADAMDPRSPRNPHAHALNAPSCVYLG